MRFTVSERPNTTIAICALALVLATSACRPSHEVRPAFTKEESASPGELRGTIVFTGRDGRATRLFAVNAASDTSPVRVTPRSVEERSPALSPDGKLMATAVITGNGKSGITVRPAGGGPRRLVVDGGGLLDYPAWSPDGKQLVYSHVGGRDTDWNLHVVGLDGKGDHTIVGRAGQDWDPAWSPDGKSIAFTSDRNGTNDIWLYDVKARSATKISESRGQDLQPAWSPDGTRIAFSSNRERRRWQLFVIDMATLKTKRLLRTTGMDRFPTWSPDGRYILVSNGYAAVYRADGAKFSDGADRLKLGSRLALSSAWTKGGVKP